MSGWEARSIIASGRARVTVLRPHALVRIAFNVLRTLPARRRILHMRAVFNRYADHLGAVAIVAVKP